MLSLLMLKSSVFLINFPFSTSHYSRLPSSNVIPIWKCSHNACCFVMIILLAYNFRSSTKKLWVMWLFLSIPYEYPLMVLSIKDNGLNVNMNHKTIRMSPWNIHSRRNIPFRNLMVWDVIVSFSLIRWSNAHRWMLHVLWLD